ncbi:hypothetical protein MKW92_041463, partial [Papaver armeniacum]
MNRGRSAGKGFKGGRRRREPPSSTTNSGGQFLLNLLPNQSQQPQKNPSFTSSNHTLHHHHHQQQQHLDPAGPCISYPPPWNLQSNGAIDPSSQFLPPPGFFPPNPWSLKDLQPPPPPASCSSSHFPGPEFPDELFRRRIMELQTTTTATTTISDGRSKERSTWFRTQGRYLSCSITRKKQSNVHGGFQGDLQWLSGQFDHPGPPPGSNLHSVPASAIEESQVKLHQIGEGNDQRDIHPGINDLNSKGLWAQQRMRNYRG